VFRENAFKRVTMGMHANCPFWAGRAVFSIRLFGMIYNREIADRCWLSSFWREKSLTTKDTKYAKKKSLDFFGFSFVTVVSFVFKKSRRV
jgi:hypothetical protein